MVTLDSAATISTVFRLLAAGVDLTHALLMLAWGLGLPLLFWHRFARLSRVYVGFCAIFVAISLASNQVLGECVLTTLARQLWQAAGGYRDAVPFTVLFVNAIAGIRPTAREAVLAWEAAIFVTTLGLLFWWRKTRSGAPAPGLQPAVEASSHAGAADRTGRAMLTGVESSAARTRQHMAP